MKSGPDQDVANLPFSGFFFIGRNPIPLHMLQNDFQNLFVFLPPQHTICVGDDGVCPSGIKSRNGISLLVLSDGVLGFVAVAKRLLHAYNRLHDTIQLLGGKSPDPHQVIPHLIFLETELSFVGHRLNLASAALSVKRAGRLHTKRRRCEHLL